MLFFTSFRDPKPNALTHKTFMGEVEILGMSNAHYPRYIVPLSPNALFMWVSFKVQCYFEFDPISYLFFCYRFQVKSFGAYLFQTRFSHFIDWN